MRKTTFATLLFLISATLAYGIQAGREWVKFTSPEGRFSVLLPHEPKFEAVIDPTVKEVTNAIPNWATVSYANTMTSTRPARISRPFWT